MKVTLREIQERLIEGGAPIRLTETNDWRMKQALLAFQRAHHLYESGRLDHRTSEELDRWK